MSESQIQKLILKGNPKSINTLYGHTGKRKYMNHAGRALKEDYQWQVKNQWQADPLEDRLKMTIEFYFKDKRKRDLDNFNKIVLDSMEGFVFNNDGQIDHLTLIRACDEDNPRAEISLEVL